MGKSKKQKKKDSSSKGRKEKAVGPRSALPHSKHTVSLPLPFPSELSYPKDQFLRNEDPYKESFQAALETAYEGLAVDLPEPSHFPHKDIQTALGVLENAGFFRTDVTQPFGLGTKLAKTYVTRCLLGEKGTTYKYLGLRMFSHPWDAANNDEKLQNAIHVFRDLNRTLTERTTLHLSELDEKKQKRGGEPTRGRAGFDITLINRMTNSNDLKKEPSMGHDKCSVSWHADSSLEHYSTIAVYQTIVDNDKSEGNWSVALRVAHNSEGPNASRRGTDMESSIVTTTPPIAVSLPSGSAYYLLDDFNHHHQHAVLASGGVRYSSTHRLLRESHNVSFLLERCKKVCSSFHKKGPKIWRSEQLLLTEVESEWIRQFYIQGQQHYDLLWKAWEEPIKQLLKYWSQLETRTKQTAEFLQAAAEGRCGLDASNSTSGPPPSRAERKKREKRKKALDALNELVGRATQESGSVLTNVYEPFSALLLERAEMRRQWTKREKDHVFREVEHSQRPLQVPFDFNVIDGKKQDDCAVSPMSGLPDELCCIAENLKAWGRACASGDPSDLPALSTVDKKQEAKGKPVEQSLVATVSSLPSSEHSMSFDWEGWGRFEFGLEMQSPWAGFLLEGKKTIETRAYDLPPALLGRRILILESKKGSTVSKLGNAVSIGANENEAAVRRVGWCTFTKVIKYTDRESFEADEAAHMVKKDSAFGWKEDTKIVYGWVVGEFSFYNGAPQEILDSIVRRYRSLFELRLHKPKSEGKTKKRKKRKRY